MIIIKKAPTIAPQAVAALLEAPSELPQSAAVTPLSNPTPRRGSAKAIETTASKQCARGVGTPTRGRPVLLR